MTEKYTTAKDGEWVQPVRRGYKVACCDCGLVHRIDIRVVDGRVQFRAVRDKKATAARRREAMNANGTPRPEDAAMAERKAIAAYLHAFAEASPDAIMDVIQLHSIAINIMDGIHHRQKKTDD